MRNAIPVFAALALLTLAPPAQAHLLGPGACADDGEVHLHGGFGACASTPSLCLGIPVEPHCVPHVCLYVSDVQPTLPQRC